jgi:hypothetical protein
MDGDVSQDLEKLFNGALVLKNEKNGFHIRWLVVNGGKQFLYWFNPKNEVVNVDSQNIILISQIVKIEV